MQNHYKIHARILLPPLICGIIVYYSNLSIEYYPMLFGLIIGLINWDVHVYKPLLGILLSILTSYASFFIALFSSFVFGYIQEYIMETTDFVISDRVTRNFSIIVTSFIIAPLLVFFLYRYVFNIPNSKISLIITGISIILLVLISYSFIEIEDKHLLNPFFLWQIIMALAIQLILYQKELKTLFKPKNV